MQWKPGLFFMKKKYKMKASKNKVQSLIKSMKHGPYNVFTNELEKYHMAVILQKN